MWVYDPPPSAGSPTVRYGYDNTDPADSITTFGNVSQTSGGMQPDGSWNANYNGTVNIGGQIIGDRIYIMGTASNAVSVSIVYHTYTLTVDCP